MAGAIALSGCTAGPEQVHVQHGVAGPPSAEEVDQTGATPPPGDCAADGDPTDCHIKTDECHVWEFTSNDDPEQVVGWKQQIPVDGGPIEYARGETILSADGTPAAYNVAPEDLGEFVARRFCINTAYLSTINSIRRNGALMLYVGDTLNLDAHTIVSVGDENGVVYDNDPPDPIPPQH
jgi:hypothetical protein